MTDRLEEQELLEGARRALSPTPADAERVLNATRAAIASAAVAGAYATVASPSHAAGAMPFGAAAQMARWKLALSALSIAAVSGAVGYYLGLHGAPQAEAHVGSHVGSHAEVVASAPIAFASPSVGPSVSGAASRVAAAPGAATPPAADNTAPASTAAGAIPPTASRVPPKRSAPLANAAPNQAPADEPIAFSSQEEITAMRRVERALREHEPQRALTLLFELDRNVPDGKLMQERQAAFAMARCAAGLGSAPQLVAEFAARYRNSAYLARVRQTCAAHDAPASPQ